MSRILVLYYSSYGHVELMARAQAEGVARVADAEVTVKRVPELTPPDIAKAAGFLVDQSAPIAQPDELEGYDAIIFGTPTRFGNMASQMRNFLDQTGGLWARNALVGKIGSVFCSTASQHGGQETTGCDKELRMPTKLELEMCRFQGEHVATIAARFVAGARTPS